MELLFFGFLSGVVADQVLVTLASYLYTRKMRNAYDAWKKSFPVRHDYRNQ